MVLVTLLSSGSEVQYVGLRNILLIIQRRPAVLQNEVKVFFCKYNDPIYIKLAKLEIMYRLTREENVSEVLAELKEYASEVDVDFVRKAVRSIGRLAIKIASASDQCITTLLNLMQTKISYVVQEAIVVIKDIFRRYPNQYESIIGTLCENLDVLDEPEAKAAMIWIVGQYADRIENSDELLEDFCFTFKEEPAEVSGPRFCPRVYADSRTATESALRCNWLCSPLRSSCSSGDRRQERNCCQKCSSWPRRKRRILTCAIE
jgi:AP-2 complex subunit beta-1